MGQSASRAQRLSPSGSSTPSRRADSSTSNSSPRTNASPVASSNASESSAGATRKSRRRSVFNLISRSSSSQSPSSAPDQDQDESSRRHSLSLRKRWRSSRRFSKAHSQLDALKEPASDSSSPESAHEALYSSEALPITPAEPHTSAGPSHSTRPSTPFPSSRPATPPFDPSYDASAEHLSQQERRLSENIGNWLSGSPPPTTRNLADSEPSSVRPSHPDSLDIEREIHELLSSPQADDGAASPPDADASTGVEPSDRLLDATTQTQAPPRHFPPPGTLVVVQGVVNTTDTPHGSSQSASRTTNTSAPPPPPPESLLVPPPQRRSSSAPRSSRSGLVGESNRRSGLSSLMPRPTSMISRRPSTSSRISATPGTNRYSDPPRLSDPVPLHAQESTSSSSSDESSQGGDSDTVTPTDSESGAHALSPGSIDVLGTLLSVAAAATAASLFTPGFSNAASPIIPTDASLPSATRPTSPTPTAGLGTFGGLNRLAELSLDPSSNSARPPQQQPEQSQNDRDARDRIRSVWENFRERLGLGGPRGSTGPVGPSTGPTTSPQTGEAESLGGNGAGQSPRLRPGELMLAEMARALNAGLGLTNSSERRSSSDQSAASSSAADRSNAGPGPASTPSSDTEERTRPLSPDPGFEAFLTSLQADLRTVLSGNLSPPVNGDADPLPHPSRDGDHVLSANSAGPQHDADVPADVLPFADDFDSDLDSVAEDTDRTPPLTEQPLHHTRTPTPIPPATTLPHPMRSDNEEETTLTGDRRQPAINLWRVYRFPPIPAPPGHALRMSVPLHPDSSQDAPASSPAAQPAAESAHTDATADSHTDSELPSGSASDNADSNVVVPVIVVGLQSVDTAPDRAELEDGPSMPHDATRHDEPSFEHTEDFTVPPHEDALRGGGPATPRGRSWQSRAANALRGLRPGRRNGSRGRRASENSGSRTFLIYVIGGYYPPNHHVVTGSDSLDNYEALWELADLLGQVKPPVATREDIDNSGLEIVQASEMKVLEKEGRIASNCIDRCLICLDDYEFEQDVRVMSCRHAFHKDCVDKWLQVGRNNCPACRSKGVSTSTDSAPPLPSPMVPLS